MALIQPHVILRPDANRTPFLGADDPERHSTVQQRAVLDHDQVWICGQRLELVLCRLLHLLIEVLIALESLCTHLNLFIEQLVPVLPTKELEGVDLRTTRNRKRRA
jgi:hypothetical protein